ncbi:hypothetical protein Tco_1309690 [Tanacetum coccineum]
MNNKEGTPKIVVVFFKVQFNGDLISDAKKDEFIGSSGGGWRRRGAPPAAMDAEKGWRKFLRYGRRAKTCGEGGGVLGPVLIQQDNVKPPIDVHDGDFFREDRFDIRLRFQPPNSPDLNVLDLGFVGATQSL